MLTKHCILRNQATHLHHRVSYEINHSGLLMSTLRTSTRPKKKLDVTNLGEKRSSWAETIRRHDTRLEKTWLKQLANLRLARVL